MTPERLHALRHYYIQGRWSSEVEELFSHIDKLEQRCSQFRDALQMIALKRPWSPSHLSERRGEWAAIALAKDLGTTT